MGLSIRQIGAVLDEIKTDLRGGILRRIDQPHPRVILFEIAHLGKRYSLLFSGHRRYSRYHLSWQKYSNPKSPPSFCQLLRAHLRYKSICVIEQLGEDRIIQIKCAWLKDDTRSVTFVAELIGPASNFFLTDAEGRIMGALSAPNPSRALGKGLIYLPPPPAPPKMSQKAAFSETFIPLIEPAPFRLNRSIEIYYSELEKREASALEKRMQLIQFDQTIRRFRTRLNRCARQLAEAEKSVRYKIYAEYLKCHLHEIKTGVDHFSYPGDYPALPEKEEVIVPLNPALSAAENMARFFKRYKKGKIGQSMLLKLIEKTRVALIHLEQGRDAVSKDKIIEISDFPITPLKKDRNRKQRKKRPPIYLSSDNMRLIVGRNDLENEAVTFRMARGNDLWLHARGVPGSHLIVQMMKSKEIPPQTLLEAATLALFFSRHKKSGKGEVVYTLKKYIQRPKNAKPGSVIYSQEKTIYIEILPSRLSGILQNRIDEE